MELYRLKVALAGEPKIYRIIEATGNCTFEALHEVIFDAFDRDDEHMYSFFLTGKKMKNIRKIYTSPEITHPMAMDAYDDTGKENACKIRLEDCGLFEKAFLYYLFDFGDNWWHEIRVESITDSPNAKEYIKIVEKVGDSPPQYEYDEDEDWDEEDS